ncbi:MAG: PA-phosphatase [Brevundimonas sp.]|uniref:PA-phosphatase n=1 Tax=Brevundimonas sp. TaxID=1871086 RepID=UPI00391C9AB6
MKPAAAIVAAGLLTVACAGVRTPAPTGPTPGYLPPGRMAALVAEAATWRDRDDLAASEALRALEDTDRWWMAIAHAELRPPEAAQHFDCVLGTLLAASPRPALSRIMNRLLTDSTALSARLAAAHPRPRPIVADPSRRACQRMTDADRSRGSWPATGAVIGAAYGELFASLAPDRAAHARAMGREIGVSRAVCAMNWPSDVEDGLRLGQALYARAETSPAFQPDLEAARAELARARTEGLTSPACAAERRALRPGGD